jgi:hypothetical protein
MREFPQEALLSSVMARNELKSGQIDALAARLAAFHASAASAPPSSAYGRPEGVLQVALDNFAALVPLAGANRTALRALERWTREEHAARAGAFAQRHAGGAIRECHGDLHLANVALIGGEPTMFDCIEFNDAMRWIDPMSEVAFTAMDLEHRGRADLAHRFVSAYLEHTGDYAGCAVLRFYRVYRAMVRAKVAGLRAAQLPSGDARAQAMSEVRAYVELASRCVEPHERCLVVMHGPSGCGKSTLAQFVVERTGAIRIRTDVERKRLAGLPAGARTSSAFGSGLYGDDMSRRTYEHALRCARDVLDGGFVALVDGAFLRKWQRDAASAEAATKRAAFLIVDCIAARETLQARVAARAAAGTDASEATLDVLAHQLESEEPLAVQELPQAIACRTDGPMVTLFSAGAWREVIERVRRPAPAPRHAVAQAQDDTTFADRLVFLSRPGAHVRSATVETIETPASWVFLTERDAYKLRKPLHDAHTDLRSLQARERNGIEQLAANRRFGTDVHLGLAALKRRADGRMRLDGEGETVDWLVRMRRLQTERMLDRLLPASRLDARDFEPLMRLLVGVYRRDGTAFTEDDYRRRLMDGICAQENALLRPESGSPRALVRQVADRQRAFAQHTGHLLDRVRAFRIVEGHGDLVPGHVCLEHEPRVIGAPECARGSRICDAADELALLALECERLGAPEARHAIFEAYERVSGDRPPPALIEFYESMRACRRAILAAPQAARYLDLALEHVTRCTAARYPRSPASRD